MVKRINDYPGITIEQQVELRQAAVALEKQKDQLERDNADLKLENERLTQKTLDQFVEIQDLRRVAND